MNEDNFTRGDRAEAALKAVGYGHAADTKDNPVPLPDGGEVIAFEGYPISDLIADLGHFAARHEFDFAQLITEGVEHFGADCVEQAFQADQDDRWTGALQDPENEEVAKQILTANNVPEEHWQGVLVKVGLRDA